MTDTSHGQLTDLALHLGDTAELSGEPDGLRRALAGAAAACHTTADVLGWPSTDQPRRRRQTLEAVELLLHAVHLSTRPAPVDRRVELARQAAEHALKACRAALTGGDVATVAGEAQLTYGRTAEALLARDGSPSLEGLTSMDSVVEVSS